MPANTQMLSNRKLIALIGSILILAVVLGAVLWLTRPKGPNVVVTVDGKEYGSYSLYTDCTVVVHPEDNSWHNTLVIHDRQASITESDCANQICVMTPPLQEDMVGIIVCLPHGLVAELR